MSAIYLNGSWYNISSPESPYVLGYYKESDGKFYEEDTYINEITAELSKLYISLDTKIQYSWNGSEYVEISEVLQLGETSSTAYRGDRGKIAYDDSQANKTHIGDLTQLTTTAKTDLVSAINEAAQTGGSGGGQEIQKISLSAFNQLTTAEKNNGKAYFIPDAYYSDELPDNVSIKVTTLPTASSDEVNNIYQYVGATTNTYTHGYFYECVEDDSTNPSTYSWENINVQASSGGSGGGVSDFDELTNLPEEATDISDVITPLPSTPFRGIKYSTEEQVIGSWIDGKPLYQKTITGTTPSTANAWGNLASLGTTCNLIMCELYVLNDGGNVSPIPFGADNVRYILNYDATSNTTKLGYICMNPGTSVYKNKSFYMTVKYTKTTD